MNLAKAAASPTGVPCMNPTTMAESLPPPQRHTSPAAVSNRTPTPQLDDETRALITALATVNGHIPRVVRMLAQDQLPVEKEREFADLLINLGDLLSEHAKSRTRMGTIRQKTM